ncbi:MAG TPA: hypothetical protein VER36_02115 [Flavisolibacter sp.]|nr:hypothetical protein [Flavisolibacter sp.]
MKRTVISLSIVALLALLLSSCASQRDCQGVRHTRLSNGVTI